MSLLLRAKRVNLVNLALPAAGGGNRRLLQSTSDGIAVEEFLDKHLAPSEAIPPFKGVTSTRREVLSLYRDVWRATRVFTWPNEQGVPWRDVLRLSARREFESAQLEKDPMMIAKLILVGRDAIRTTLGKFEQKREVLISQEESGYPRKL